LNELVLETALLPPARCQHWIDRFAGRWGIAGAALTGCDSGRMELAGEGDMLS
jgi:hypothetical protein